MNMDKAQAERELDAPVKELWGRVPEGEILAQSEMERLRQRVADASTNARAAKPAIGMDLEGRLIMQGVQAGSISMLEIVLDWIDEIKEGSSEDHQSLD